MYEARGTVDPKQAGVRMQWGIKIRLRDGVRLNATLYLPHEHAAPTPTIVTLTPYVAQTFHDRGMYFAAHGYPFLAVDVRGRGNSEGVFHPLVNEAKDAFDVIEWLASQPYCSSQVTMWGGSYGGYVQWAAAKEFPPHLAAIVPVASPYVGVDFPFRCNIPTPYLMQWLTLVWGRTSQDKLFWSNELHWGAKFREWFKSGAPFRELDSQLGSASAIFQEWLAHPQQDEYWASCNPCAEQYARIAIPILTVTGIYDGDQPGALAHYREHMRHASAATRARHYLVIGPWDHAGTRSPVAEFCGLKVGPESLVDLGKLHLDWYAWTMQGGPKPQFLRQNVAYYVTGAEKWRYAETLEAVTTQVVAHFLHSSGNPSDVFRSGWFSTEPPQSGGEPDYYHYDPRDVSLAELESTIDPESRVDHRMVYAAVGKQLVYHGTPITQDIEISGFFTLTVWLSIDTPDTDIRAAIYEVGLDGTTVQLTCDWMRARHRESLREATLIQTREPLRYVFERFTFTARRIAKGCRLRLVIGPINSIYSQKNYNSGGVVAEESVRDARTATVRLHHDPEHPSALYIPFGRSDG